MPRDYPATVVEILDDSMTFLPATLRAVRAFKKSRPWTGTIDERKEKFRQLNRDLAVAYGVAEPELIFGDLDGSTSGASHYIPSAHRIVLVGRLSVVTCLHEIAHARGMGEHDACRWSVNLFRQVFPRQFARLIQRGHTLVRPEDQPTQS